MNELSYRCIYFEKLDEMVVEYVITLMIWLTLFVVPHIEDRLEEELAKDAVVPDVVCFETDDSTPPPPPPLPPPPPPPSWTSSSTRAISFFVQLGDNSRVCYALNAFNSNSSFVPGSELMLKCAKAHIAITAEYL